MQTLDHKFTFSNDGYRQKVKQTLHNRRYTSDANLEPPTINGGVVACKAFLLPDIEQFRSNESLP